jgi:hypothetical protein
MKLSLCLTLTLALSSFSSRLAAQAALSSEEAVPTAADGGAGAAAAPAHTAGADDEEELMIAAAVAKAEQAAPRIGASIGIEAVRSFRAPHTRGLGASVAFTFKFENPRGIGQIGLTGWPSAFYRGPEHAADRLDTWEVFLAASVLPITLGPVDVGFYLLLAANNFTTSLADRAVLGVAAQWSFDRVWALRYQLGFTAGANILNVGLVSTLAIDMVFPYI